MGSYERHLSYLANEPNNQIGIWARTLPLSSSYENFSNNVFFKKNNNNKLIVLEEKKIEEKEKTPRIVFVTQITNVMYMMYIFFLLFLYHEGKENTQMVGPLFVEIFSHKFQYLCTKLFVHMNYV